MVSPQGVAVDSADEAAAAQAAALLRAAARGEVRGTREFSVYPLKNASAERLATVLSGIYRDYGRGGRLRFAADERINAVIVKGAKAERREAEALLESLDTSREVEYYKPDQPVVLTLRHANAKQVYAQLQNLYRSELQRGSKQPPIEIPPGADPELVATLQQINASREGPLLSLEVDSDTNSLLVIAPRPLVKEISEFAEQVDARSTESRIGVRVVPLESLQGKEVLQSLQRIFGERRP
jgi:type II secretory pathway component GspD/PulD (secretin)